MVLFSKKFGQCIGALTAGLYLTACLPTDEHPNPPFSDTAMVQDVQDADDSQTADAHFQFSYNFPTVDIRFISPADAAYAGPDASYRRDQADQHDRRDSTTTSSDEPEKWVRVGNEHPEQYCPDGKKYLWGECYAPEDLACVDTDETKIYFIQTPEGYFQKVIAQNDPSITTGGTTTLSVTSSDSISVTYSDTCKGTQFLEEFVCHDGAAEAIAIACDTFIAGSCCKIDEAGLAYCDTDEEEQVFDHCPETLEIEEEFPFDNNNDGFPESCKEDKCLMVDGEQAEYLFDTDEDGTPDACAPVSEDFCSDPQPEDTYPDGTLYKYQDQWYMGFCLSEGENTLLKISCAEDGKWYADLAACEYDMPCVNGACGECYDSDGEKNYDQIGLVKSFNSLGLLVTHGDSCVKGTYDSKKDFFCKPDGKVDDAIEECSYDEICEENIMGTATLACVPSLYKPICSDFDGPGVDYPTISKIEYITKEGDFDIASDGCHNTNTADAIRDWTCLGGALPKEQLWWCSKMEKCDVNEEGKLACVPSNTELTCEDSDGKGNFTEKGWVKGKNKQGKEYILNDECIKSTSPIAGIVDWICLNNETYTSVNFFCDEGETCKEKQEMVDGQPKTKFVCEPICFDSDPENLEKQFGTVFDFKGEPYHDVCEGKKLLQYMCDPVSGETIEVPAIVCETDCKKGVCL